MAVLALFMRIGFEVELEPEASPAQPAKTYCVPVVSESVSGLIVACTVVPAEYHP